MHIADPTLGIFGANGIVAAGIPIAVGAAAAAQLRARRRRGRGVLRRRRAGAGGVPRGREPGRRVAAAGGVLLREQRLRRVLPGGDAARRRRSSARAAGYGVGYVAVDGNDVVATAAVMADVVDVGAGGGRAGRGRGGHLPVARPLRGRPRAVPVARGARGVAGAATRCSCTSGVLRDGRGARRRAQGARGVGGRRRSTAPSRRPAACEPAVASTLSRLRRPPPSVAARARARRAADAPVFRTMDAVRAGARDRAGVRRARVRGRHRRRRGRQRLRPDPGAARAVRRPGARHADLRDRHRRASASARRWPGMRPVVEVMYLDFLGVCFDQLLNQAAKLPFMTGGAARMGLTVRTQFGAGRSSGSQHSPEPRGAARPHPGPDASSCRRRRPTPTACCAPPSRTRTRSCSSRTGCSTA